FRSPIVAAHTAVCADRRRDPRSGHRRERDGLQYREHGGAPPPSVPSRRRHRSDPAPDARWQQRQFSDARLSRVARAARRILGPDSVRMFGPVDIYLILPVPLTSDDRTNSFRVIARVAPGTSRTQAEAQIDTMARREAQQRPALTNMPEGVVLRSLQEDLVG